MTFRALCGDSPDTLTTVARFLALLELFREGAVAFDQVTPLGELTVRWTGERRRRRRGRRPTIDEFEGAPPEPAPTSRDPERRHRDRADDRGPGRARRRAARTVLDVAVAELRPVAGGGADGRRPAARRSHAGDGGRLPGRRGVGRAGRAGRRSTPSRGAASSCATSPAAGATTPARSSPRSSRRSSSTASRPG